MTPLQSHNQFTEIPVFPKEPFISYGPEDESFLRWSGRWKTKRVLIDLYDVRDEENELIGYTNQNPIKVFGSGRPCWEIPIMDDKKPLYSCPMDLSKISPIRSITLTFRIWAVENLRFVYWECPKHEAPALIRAKWITTLGEENIHEFSHRIQREAFERIHRI